MDHYRILQVSREAEPEVIEKAYRALCMKYHPDVVPEQHRAEATRRMQRINEAYQVLSDPRSRARYDATLVRSRDTRGAGWERFWQAGLAGLFLDWLESRT